MRVSVARPLRHEVKRRASLFAILLSFMRLGSWAFLHFVSVPLSCRTGHSWCLQFQQRGRG
jgi:hypothetical protein